MGGQDYTDELRPILAARAAEAARRLAQLRSAADEAGDRVEGIVIDVFVDQDGEGPFDVWARFEGDAAFELDRRFDEERHLFGVEWGEDGWEPEVPGRPRGWTRDDLERSVLTAVTEWISPLLPALPALPQEEPGAFWHIGTPDGAGA